MAFPTLHHVHAKLKACRRCPGMCSRAVYGAPVESRILLLGQAPGVHEETFGRPFAYTAGRTLFKWFREATGADEAWVRENIYFAAVARCFPGKSEKGAGDRVPNREEIANCREHLSAEVQILRPELILAVGKLAITEALGRPCTLNEVVGKLFTARFCDVETKVLPLPHPSGVSRWPHSPEGKKKLGQALKLLRAQLNDFPLN